MDKHPPKTQSWGKQTGSSARFHTATRMPRSSIRLQIKTRMAVARAHKEAPLTLFVHLREEGSTARGSAKAAPRKQSRMGPRALLTVISVLQPHRGDPGPKHGAGNESGPGIPSVESTNAGLQVVCHPLSAAVSKNSINVDRESFNDQGRAERV
eukprot:CAMPEP_0174830912 /NCGR_PEP_ID=MMETSP1114-20130205/2799_1 /TAXON_ID=312471 /ORGANISM="Neobodo designis, Strain CCAP 1951/1" /LENGTH=153 /DNA_ID=CAMNT_0016064725 /DNA_START=217 /DNA_END=679 /DNA_ORIENTATION=-